MTDSVQFPERRAEVIGAFRSLSDPEHQRVKWGKCEPGDSYYDDLDLNVHILFDDVRVLPDPESAVPAVLHESEVSVMLPLNAVLSQIIGDLGDRPDEAYLSDPRWLDVIRTSREVLRIMEFNDGTRLA